MPDQRDDANKKEELKEPPFESLQCMLEIVLCGMIKNHTDREDVLQETRLSMWRSWSQCKSKQDCRRWALSIGIRRAVEFVRRDARRNKRTEPHWKLETMEESHAGPNNEVLLELEDAVSQLSPDDQKIFHLRFEMDMSLEELGTYLGCHSTNAGKRAAKVRERLRKILQKEGISID